VTLHGLPAALVELGQAVVQDLALAGQAELLLDRHLHRQAVTVPAGLAVHPVAAHGLEPGKDVLEHARLDVVHAGNPVGGGRALIEGPGGSVGGLLDRAPEGVLLLPQREHLALERGQVHVGRDRAVRVAHLESSFVSTPRRRGEQLAKGRPASDADRGTTLLDRCASAGPLPWSPLLVLVTGAGSGVLPAARGR
jgi:hypothetical protein